MASKTKPAPPQPKLQSLSVATVPLPAKPTAVHKGPKKDYNTLMREQEECLDKFLKDLTYMVAALQSKNPRDEDFKEMRDKYMVVKSEVPTAILHGAGKALWKYRDRIASADKKAEDFFLSQDFTQDYADARNELPEADNFERFPEVLQKIKLTWHCFSAEEKNQVWTRAKNLLKYYASYESNRRALEELKQS